MSKVEGEEEGIFFIDIDLGTSDGNYLLILFEIVKMLEEITKVDTILEHVFKILKIEDLRGDGNWALKRIDLLVWTDPEVWVRTDGKIVIKNGVKYMEVDILSEKIKEKLSTLEKYILENAGEI